MNEVSLILPVYNEEGLILKTLDEITKYFESVEYDYEIIVVDDKSNDNSVALVKNFNNKNVKLICKGKNEGKGSAIKEGVKHATKDYIGFMDADLPYSLNNIGDILKELKNYDVAIGSRLVEGSKVDVHPTGHRKLLGRIFCIVRNFIIHLNIKDTQSGLKFFKKEIAKDIFDKQRINGFGFDVEILYLANKKGYKIKEVPIHLLKEHSFKKSKLKPIKDSLKMFFDLISIKVNDLRGKYE